MGDDALVKTEVALKRMRMDVVALREAVTAEAAAARIVAYVKATGDPLHDRDNAWVEKQAAQCACTPMW
ncbi:G protein gamma domain-containing protein [Plasmodiophora brassicae]|uniref:G protein gamma domain-containing protein n=1 Tax=Plasmodiophora brassicae TaxID=37360 RepID=A0A0G4J3R6_PLABS|nr:hypothetical protein PBRA_002533 [Plasmodiophora brassicae]